MATLEDLYNLRKIFRDYDAPVPKKLKIEIRGTETLTQVSKTKLIF